MNGPIKTSQPATNVGPSGRANADEVRCDQLVTGSWASAAPWRALPSWRARDTTLAVLVGLVVHRVVQLRDPPTFKALRAV